MDTDVRILQDVLEYACINRHFEMVESLTSLLSQRGVKVVEKGSVLSIRLACCVVDQELSADQADLADIASCLGVLNEYAQNSLPSELSNGKGLLRLTIAQRLLEPLRESSPKITVAALKGFKQRLLLVDVIDASIDMESNLLDNALLAGFSSLTYLLDNDVLWQRRLEGDLAGSSEANVCRNQIQACVDSLNAKFAWHLFASEITLFCRKIEDSVPRESNLTTIYRGLATGRQPPVPPPEDDDVSGAEAVSTILRSAFKAGALREALKVLQAAVPAPVSAPAQVSAPVPAQLAPVQGHSDDDAVGTSRAPVAPSASELAARVGASPARSAKKASATASVAPISRSDPLTTSVDAPGWSQDWAGFLELDPAEVRGFASSNSYDDPAVGGSRVLKQVSPPPAMPSGAIASHPSPAAAPAAGSADAAAGATTSPQRKRKIVFERLPTAVQLDFEHPSSQGDQSDGVADDSSVVSIDSGSASEAPLKQARVLPASLSSKSGTQGLGGRGRRAFSMEEEAMLRKGVARFGVGNWKEILAAYSHVFKGRTTVNLKDKWRNMMKE